MLYPVIQGCNLWLGGSVISSLVNLTFLVGVPVITGALLILGAGPPDPIIN